MKRPNIEAWEAYECRDWIKDLFCWIHDLESQLKAEQESVNELSLHCQGLEDRIKGAEEALEFYADSREGMWENCEDDNQPKGLRRCYITGTCHPREVAREALKGLGKRSRELNPTT